MPAYKDDTAKEVTDLVNEWWEFRHNAYDDVWLKCFYNYLSEYDSTQRWLKHEGEAGRSKIFIGITRRKIYAIYNKVMKALSQATEYPYTIEPSPDNDLPRQMQDIYVQAMDKMKRRMDDQLLRMKWGRKVGRHIITASVFGPSIVKFPVVKRLIRERYRTPSASMMPFMDARESFYAGFMEPVLERKDEVYPDMEVLNPFLVMFDSQIQFNEPQALQTGRGVAEYRVISHAELQRLSLNASYKTDKIKEILRLDRDKEQTTEWDIQESLIKIALSEYNSKRKGFRMVHFWGLMRAKDLRAFGADVPSEYDAWDYLESVVDIIEGMNQDVSTIRAQLNPFRPIRRPYLMLPYEDNLLASYPRGYAQNIMGEQSMLNSAMRIFIDNKALAGIPPMVQNAIGAPPGTATKVRTLKPGAIYNSYGTPAKDYMSRVDIPDVSDRMIPLVELLERYINEVGGINQIATGMTSQNLNDTASGMAMLIEMASETVQGFMQNIDDYFIEPFMESLYHYNMQFDSDMTIKGDYEVKAGGMHALAQQQIYWQRILHLLNSVGSQLPPELIAKLIQVMAKSMGVKEVYEYMEGILGKQPTAIPGGTGNSQPIPAPGMARPQGAMPPGGAKPALPAQGLPGLAGGGPG